MNFQAWLHHIEHCSPQVMDFGLTRMQQMLARLALSSSSLGFVITVAGTNGKGTSAGLLEACFLAAGRRVGLYTSPHLCAVTERIRWQGHSIDEADLMLALQAVEAQRHDLPLTYFEFMTLAAVYFFHQQSPEVVILEVGLGGRLDAVNSVDADLAIITSIGLDHQAYLGDTLAQIAVEKSGIMRAHHPVVYGGDQVGEVITQQAQHLGAHLCARPAFSATKTTDKAWDWQGVDADGQPLFWSGLPLPRILLDNAATCLQALQFLPANLQLCRRQIETGLASVQVLGRLQWLTDAAADRSPAVLLDVAHNPAAVEKVLAYLAEVDCSIYRRIIAVFGVMADKDWSAMVALLSQRVTHWVPVQPDDARALAHSVLAQHLSSKGQSRLVEYLPIDQLVSGVKTLAHQRDLVLVLGSFAVVGPFLQQFFAQPFFGDADPQFDTEARPDIDEWKGT